MIQKLFKLLKNQILVYFLIRYGVYFLQFIISIVIAVKLGTSYFALWSFLLLILSYFQIIDFGISNSINVLLVQNKNDKKKTRDITTSSYYLTGGLIFIICLIAVYYFFFGFSYFDKYGVGNYFYLICIIASFVYINKLYMTIHRIKNRLYQISFFQGIIHILVLASMFFTTQEKLLNFIIGAYLVGNLLSFLVFTYSGALPRKGILKKEYLKLIINKGWYLFIYNVCFYLLAISVRTIVSIFYSVEDFAFFSFSFTIASTIILLLEAMGFVIFPKMIDKFANDNLINVKKLIDSIQNQYVTLAYGLIYIALILFPIFIDYIPKYSSALMSLSLTALSIVMYINAFGYNTYLIANNHEKIISKISLITLIVNLIIAIMFSFFFKNDYSYVIFSLSISYVLYTVSLVYFGNLKMKTPISIFNCLKRSYPLRLMIPHGLAILLVLTNNNNSLALTIPFTIFVVLNMQNIIKMYYSFLKVLKNPSIINL